MALGLVQLIPLPRPLLTLIAPGPAAVWYPALPAAAAVVGPGAHPISLDPEATRRVLAFATGMLALALLSVPALRARRAALAATLVVTGGGLVVALYGVVARTLFGPLLFGTLTVPTVAPFGSFVSKNHFAGYVEMAALLCAGLAWGWADEARRSPAAFSWVGSARAGRVIVAAGAALAMALAALLSQSRAGAVSLGAGALVLVALRLFVRRKRAGSRRGWVLGLAFVAVTAGAVAVLPSDARLRLGTLAGMGQDNSGQFRIGVWSDTLRLAVRSPLVGHGLGAYADALPPVKTGRGYVRVEHAESDVFEMLAEGGLAGLLLAALGLVGLARVVVIGLSRQTDRLRRGLGLGAASGAAALLVHSLFDFNLRIPSNALLFAFLCALALAAASATRTPVSTGAVPAPSPLTAPASPSGTTSGIASDTSLAANPATSSTTATDAATGPTTASASPTVLPPTPQSPGARHPLAALAVALALALAVVTPAAPTTALPDEARAFTAKGGRPVTPLRVAQATGAVTAHLQRRPANAEAWLFLAWLRASSGRGDDARALAGYAARLDPQRAAIQSEAVRLQAAPPP
jgi:O-antigen ligase